MYVPQYNVKGLAFQLVQKLQSVYFIIDHNKNNGWSGNYLLKINTKYYIVLVTFVSFEYLELFINYEKWC